MVTDYLLFKRCCTMICIMLLVIGMGQPLCAQSAGGCPCFNAHQLKGLFSPIVKTGGTVRCQESASGGGRFVSIYGNSVNDQSGLMMAIIAAAQSSAGEPAANFCYISPPQKGAGPEHYIHSGFDLTEAEAGACLEIIENTVQAFGGVCVGQD